MTHLVKTPAGVSKETAAAIKAENSLMVNVPNNETIKGDKKGGPKNDANSIEQNAAAVTCVSIGTGIVFDVLRRYSGLILEPIYEQAAAAGLLKSKAERAAIIEAATIELQKAATIEAVCKCIERADKKAATIEAEKAKAAKAAAERKAERDAKKTAKNNAVNAAKKAAKMSKAEFIEEKTRYYMENGVNAELAANLANNDYNNMFRK